jgi:PQQ-like domain
VANSDVYVANSQGQLSVLDAESGVPRWTTSTRGARFLALGAKRIYLKSSDGDLLIVDRATGQTVADPRSTRDRSGVNLREFDLNVTNRLNDRLYFATSSGLVLAIREIGEVRPQPLRDPKAPPFGFIPTEGDSDTPPAPADADAAPADENAPPAEDANVPQ